MGNPVRHELVNTDTVRANAEVLNIFIAARWMAYFERLNGFQTETALQFSLNLTDTRSEVRGLCVDVTKEIIVEVTDLLMVGKKSFGQKAHNENAVREFLSVGEQVNRVGEVSRSQLESTHSTCLYFPFGYPFQLP